MKFRYIPCSLDKNQTQSQLPSAMHQASLRCTHCCSRCCLERLRVRAALGLLGLPILGVDGCKKREGRRKKTKRERETNGGDMGGWKVVREGRGSVCNWADLWLAARPRSVQGALAPLCSATFLHLTHSWTQLETYRAPQHTASHITLQVSFNCYFLTIQAALTKVAEKSAGQFHLCFPLPATEVHPAASEAVPKSATKAQARDTVLIISNIRGS